MGQWDTGRTHRIEGVGGIDGSPWDYPTCPTWDSGIERTHRIEGVSGTDGSPWDYLICPTWDSGIG